MKSYKEVEFVCHNSDFPYSTPENKQIDLFKDLKQISNVLPYRQDFDDKNHKERSLAVVIMDGKSSTIRLVKDAGKKHGVEVDLINDVPEWKVDEIINKSLTGLIKESKAEEILNLAEKLIK